MIWLITVNFWQIYMLHVFYVDQSTRKKIMGVFVTIKRTYIVTMINSESFKSIFINRFPLWLWFLTDVFAQRIKFMQQFCFIFVYIFCDVRWNLSGISRYCIYPCKSIAIAVVHGSRLLTESPNSFIYANSPTSTDHTVSLVRCKYGQCSVYTCMDA